MTVKEALEAADRLRANQFRQEEKISWLSRLDGRIYRELIVPRSEEKKEAFEPYTAAELDRELLAPYPYDELYLHYLISQMDYYNAEISRYNNSSAMFNTAYQAYENAYNREKSVFPKNKFIW
ncbi:MAG: hypothetical protein KH354_00885 [Clostridiales bacterium]|nr:hypothetical protein [Clostridiales bacterium]